MSETIAASAEKVDISEAVLCLHNEKTTAVYSEFNLEYVALDRNPCVYDGQAKTPEIFLRFITANGDVEEYQTSLPEDTTRAYTYNSSEAGKKKGHIVHATLPADKFRVTYSNNVNAGTATVKIEGIGDYTGSVSQDFTIEKADAWDYLCKKYPKKMKKFIKKVQSLKNNPHYSIPPWIVKLPKLPNVGKGFKLSYTRDYGAFYKLDSNGTETNQLVRLATKKETTVPPRKGTWAYKNHERRWIDQQRIKSPKGCYYQYGNGYSSQQWRHGDITDGLDAKRLRWIEMGNSVYTDGRKINVAVVVKGNKNFSIGYFHQVKLRKRWSK